MKLHLKNLLCNGIILCSTWLWGIKVGVLTWLDTMCSSSCRIFLSLWGYFSWLFDEISDLLMRPAHCPPPSKPWKYYPPGSLTGLLLPMKCVLFVRGKKNCHILCSQLVLRTKPDVTALPLPVHTVDCWALQTRVRIKAKSFTMDDIADNDTVMAWNYGLTCRWLEGRRCFHPRSNLKQLWCNPFCIKEKKKNTGYGSWFSLLLIMNALFVQSVATVPSLFWPRVIPGFCFFFSVIPFF